MPVEFEQNRIFQTTRIRPNFELFDKQTIKQNQNQKTVFLSFFLITILDKS